MKQVKTYVVPVRSHVSADYVIQATSKEEANRIVSAEMEASLKKLLKDAKAFPRPEIEGLDGYSETIKSMISIRK